MTGMDRDEFIRRKAGAFSRIVRLEGDASTREYYRVLRDGPSLILCVDRQFRDVSPEEYPFFEIAGLFARNGIPVPEIYAFECGPGFILLQDLGDTLLESLYPSLAGGEAKRIYAELVQILVKVQSVERDMAVRAFHNSFDMDKLMFEFDFFIENALLRHFRADFTPAEKDELRRSLEGVARLLQRPDLFVLNHRDYHSRNVMILEGKPWIIDFQDARLGLPQYDLVSLLRDSYVRLDDGLFHYLKDLYFDFSRAAGVHRMGRDEFDYYFDLMAFQRNVKAAGTFGYQAAVRGRKLYEKYIATALGYLGDYAARRDELKGAAAIIGKHAGGKP